MQATTWAWLSGKSNRAGLLRHPRTARPLPAQPPDLSSLALILALLTSFILGCGGTHLLDAAMFRWPANRLNTAVRVFTAVISWVTLLALVRVLPEALRMHSPEELERMIEERTAELVTQREAAEHLNLRLQHSLADLETKYAFRTKALDETIASLKEENLALRRQTEG